MLVKDMMTRNVITVTPEHTLKQVGALLREKRISGIPVVDEEGRVIGIVTLTDMLRILDRIYRWREMERKFPELKFSDMFEKEKGEAKVSDIMSKVVFTMEEDKPIERVMEMMFNRGVHTIPIVDKEGKLVGVIGKRDLIYACFE
jgi:CBS domain-containing protein